MKRYLITTVDKDNNSKVFNFYDREEDALKNLKDLLQNHHVTFYGEVEVDGCEPTLIQKYIH